MTEQDLEQITAEVRQLDQLLRGLSDFRPYSGLINRPNDPEFQTFLDHVVASVRDGRMLSGKALAALEEALAEAQSPPLEVSDEPPDEPEPPPLIGPPVDIERITMANPTGMRELVLVADHSPQVLQEVEGMLAAEDYRVIGVRDGFEAIAIYGRLWAAIDLVILDFNLPGMSGELVFEELLAINPKMAAVVSYGISPPEKGKLNQMLARGLNGFLSKPYERGKLLRQIQSVLAHRAAGGARH
jgi:CheY-like chemotaxis protein